MCPVGSYYKEGIHPVKIAVESKYVRTVAGGTGTAKTAGNYAASLKAQEVAEESGYSQVLWLDGVEKKYIEEVGSMNIFFKINGDCRHSCFKWKYFRRRNKKFDYPIIKTLEYPGRRKKNFNGRSFPGI